MADGTRAPPGAASGFAAYVALWVGYLAVGQATQQRNIVAGLWVTEILAIALPAILAIRLTGLPARPFLGLRAPRRAHLVAAVLVAVANQPVVSFVTWASRTLSPEPWVREFDLLQRALDLYFSQQALPMVITVAVAAPLGEELFFRGYAVPTFARSWGPLAACIVTGAMFSLLHGNKIGFAGLWEIGILLAVLRLWSGSLWPSILCHATNNAVAGAAFLLGWEDPDIPPPAWLLALGAVLLAAGIALLPRVLRRATPVEPADAPSQEPPRSSNSRLLQANWLLLQSSWVAAVILGIAQLRGMLAELPMWVWLGLSAVTVIATAAAWWRESA
jgi:membrane protease YdiL (CAAX protease family)